MKKVLFFVLVMGFSGAGLAAPASLFVEVGPVQTSGLPAHLESERKIRLNRAALHGPSMLIELEGQILTAIRSSFDRSRAGQHIWTGFLQGNEDDTVVVTLRGAVASGLIQHGHSVYRIGFGGDRLLKMDLQSLPPDDVEAPLDGGGESVLTEPAVAGDGNVQQDLLVVYTQGACDSAANVGSGSDCTVLEADITTAVADLNNAYAASGIQITMNLVGMARTEYAGTNASNALSDLRGTSDGQMDEVHPLRDQLGADLVALIYDGAGCGIGYLGSSASTAFSVTAEFCLVGNRTMAHELGHNQGAHHDRVTAGAGGSTNYNYGYRRCNDNTVDGTSSPWFRTVMSYSCPYAGRVGRFSNPNLNYSGVPTGVDPALVPNGGAYNALTLNNSASYVAGFRTAPEPVVPPAAPTGLTVQVTEQTINLEWLDNADNESAYDVERSQDQSGNWSRIAILPGDTLTGNLKTYLDSGLMADTTYYYRVAARNSAATVYSNEAWDTTGALPAITLSSANRDIPSRGTVVGDYSVTQVSGGEVQTIEEVEAGGPRNRRKRAYTHAWGFDLPSGGAGGVFVQVAAKVSGSEGARFSFSVDNGASWTQMFTVNSQTISVSSYDLPPGTTGDVLIQVADAAQQNGESVDSVTVDMIGITSINEVGTVPNAPSSLALSVVENSSTVNVNWQDNASDEFGFEILRGDADPGCVSGAVVGTVGADAETYADPGASPGQVNFYRVRAFNAAGSSVCSEVASVEVPAEPVGSIEASYRPFKRKGFHSVEVTWLNAQAGVDIYRDDPNRENAPAQTGAGASGSVIDALNAKGGGSYVYVVCEAGTDSCTSPEAVIF